MYIFGISATIPLCDADLKCTGINLKNNMRDYKVESWVYVINLRMKQEITEQVYLAALNRDGYFGTWEATIPNEFCEVKEN